MRAIDSVKPIKKVRVKANSKPWFDRNNLCNINKSTKDFFSKCDQIRNFLVTFTEEILNGKFHFLCSEKGDKLYSRYKKLGLETGKGIFKISKTFV